MVTEHRAVVAQGRPRAENPELDGDSVRLLPDALSRAARRLPDLDVALVRLYAHQLVGVDYRLDVGLLLKEAIGNVHGLLLSMNGAMK